MEVSQGEGDRKCGSSVDVLVALQDRSSWLQAGGLLKREGRGGLAEGEGGNAEYVRLTGETEIEWAIREEVTVTAYLFHPAAAGRCSWEVGV